MGEDLPGLLAFRAMLDMLTRLDFWTARGTLHVCWEKDLTDTPTALCDGAIIGSRQFLPHTEGRNHAHRSPPGVNMPRIAVPCMAGFRPPHAMDSHAPTGWSRVRRDTGGATRGGNVPVVVAGWPPIAASRSGVYPNVE